MSKIRVFIADDSVVARNMLSRIISAEEDMEVVGEASSGQGSIIMLDEVNPDVIMLEATIGGGMTVSEIVPELKSLNPNLKIILCAEANKREQIISGSTQGADDFIIKPYNKPVLIRTIRRIMDTH